MAESHRIREDSDLPDYDIRPGQPLDADRPPVRSAVRIWLAVAALLLAGAAAWFIVVRGPGAPEKAVTEDRAANAPAGARDQPLPLGGAAAQVDVPPLDQSDAVVRELVRQLTSHPTVAAWLATDGLIRNFTVVTANIADDAPFQRHLRTLRPAEPFAVIRQGDQVAIDPASYRRYDRVAAAVASIDADGAARLYSTLKPRIEEAYRDLGHPDTSVDRSVEQAIVRLLRTPTLDTPPRLTPGTKGIGYVFADSRLESLSPAQKQLLRMGPDNTRTIQRALRGIALALGIPAARLPESQGVS